MPKLKTNKGAAKRFGFTSSGKVKHSRGYRRHILTKKTTKRKRRLRLPGQVDATDVGRIRRMLPYG